MKNLLLKKINENAHIFYGITDSDELFVQIATSSNEVVYDAKVPISVEPKAQDLIKALKSLLPDSFKKLGIKISRFSYSDWDGQRIKKSGEKEIEECIHTQTVFPRFRYHLLSYLDFT